MYVIEKGIPIPPRQGGRGVKGELRMALESMAVNDSIRIPGKFKRSAAYLHYAGKATGFKFVSRKDGDGLRVWRVE